MCSIIVALISPKDFERASERCSVPSNGTPRAAIAEQSTSIFQ